MEVSNSYSGSVRSISIRPDYEPPQERRAPAQERSQLDPSVLARLAIEEELKKKGGGGGASRPFNPLAWVPYSFKLMAAAIERMRQAFEQAMAQGIGQIDINFMSTVREAGVATGQMIRAIVLPVTNAFTNTMQSMVNFAKAFAKDPAGTTVKLLNQISFISQVIGSAIASGLKKLFYGKDEEKLEADYEIYEDEDQSYFDRILGSVNNRTIEINNNNSIASHIQNMAKQITKAFNRY